MGGGEVDVECPPHLRRHVQRLALAYFPLLLQQQEEDSAETGPRPGSELLEREEIKEALRWFWAFGRSASACPRASLASRRARLTVRELQALRPKGLGVDGEKELLARLAKRPELFLAEVGLGIHLAGLCRSEGDEGNHDEKERVEVEVVAPELERPVKVMCSDLIGHYVGLRGNVIRAGSVSPQVQTLCFSCSRCGGEFMMPAKEGRFEWPSGCTRKCRFARFSVVREKCEEIDWQRLRLQEDFLEFSKSSGPTRGMPRTVDCDLKRGLVGSCVPGDVVTLYGIVRYMPTGGVMAHGGEGRQSSSRSLYVLFLEVKAVVNSRRTEKSSRPVSGPEEPEEDFTALQLEFIREIHQEQERFPLLVASFCPQIFGQPLVKAALLLSLVGGLPRWSEGGDQKLRRRGDIHVLLLGDPGLGKSELLRALALLSPRGIYISGNASTSAGLTAAVVRDGAGDMTLEAGALVLGDNGLCCIDEFDKMGAEQQALLEAMEQQSVSIAKAGIVCTLPARTTVVTAANPCKGTWDKTLTYAQNLKGVMTEALMSRFDLVFLMSDAEKQHGHEAALSRHIVHRRMSGSALAEVVSTQGGASSALVPFQASQRPQEHDGFRARVGRVPQDAALPPELLSTYLRYARRYARPSLTPGAQRLIKEFYGEQRRQANSCAGQMAVTARNLEALIRLSEARAKVELRPLVLKSDVEDVIEIVRAGSDFEESLPDAPVRKGKSKPNAVAEQLRQFMERRVRTGGSREFREQELLAVAKRGDSLLKEQDFDKALQRLNEVDSVLLLRGSGSYEFTGGV